MNTETKDDLQARKVLIPLIDFRYYNSDVQDNEFVPYQFKSIKAKLVENYRIETPLFSKTKIDQIAMTPYALEVLKYGKIKEDIHLLLISFRLALDYSISIKHYLYPDDPYSCSTLNETLTRDPRNRNAFISTTEQLTEVDNFCLKVKSMMKVSHRAHNAIFLLLRGLLDSNWVGAYLQWSCALESIFGRKKSGAGTEEIICRRISAYLNDDDFEYKKVKSFYNIRSRIVHGQLHLVSDENSNINLDTLFDLWRLVRACFKTLIEREGYIDFSKENKREKYFDSFDSD
ncbi:hypothetical protein K9N50_12965 [bacterium]|nr:hypothetical protein [bacterium]